MCGCVDCHWNSWLLSLPIPCIPPLTASWGLWQIKEGSQNLSFRMEEWRTPARRHRLDHEMRFSEAEYDPKQAIWGRPNNVLGVGFLLGGSPLKVSRGQLCFTATAFPKLWPQKPAVNSTDSTLVISDHSLSHTVKGQRCSSLPPAPIWLFMVDWRRV